MHERVPFWICWFNKVKNVPFGFIFAINKDKGASIIKNPFFMHILEAEADYMN